MVENWKLISKIADRAVEMFNCDKFTIVMDIENCIEGGCDIDLNGLLNADDFNFAHDISGINWNINHDTKKLMNCFVPRFAK